MDTLKYIKHKYGLRYLVTMPITLPIERQRGLTSLIKELGYKNGAEIGTSKGYYAKWLLTINKGLKLYCIDPWAAYEEYIEQHDSDGQKLLDAAYEKAKERLKPFDCTLIKKSSMEAVKDFPDNSLDFVYIDGNHTFQYVVNDIAEWEKKVRVGGMVAGHDYWRSIERRKLYVNNLSFKEKIKLAQAKDAVNGWTTANRIKPWFVTKDLSWLYIKQ